MGGLIVFYKVYSPMNHSWEPNVKHLVKRPFIMLFLNHSPHLVFSASGRNAASLASSLEGEKIGRDASKHISTNHRSAAH